MASRIKMSNPATIPRPGGAYSHVTRVSAGDLLFIAGQVGIDTSGKVAGEAQGVARPALSAVLSRCPVPAEYAARDRPPRL